MKQQIDRNNTCAASMHFRLNLLFLNLEFHPQGFLLCDKCAFPVFSTSNISSSRTLAFYRNHSNHGALTSCRLNCIVAYFVSGLDEIIPSVFRKTSPVDWGRSKHRSGNSQPILDEST